MPHAKASLKLLHHLLYNQAVKLVDPGNVACEYPGSQTAILERHNTPALWLLQCQAVLSAANK